MRTVWSLGATALLLSQTAFVLGAHAATFPDVPGSNPYDTAIHALADKLIVKGNADGTFAPDRTVNRAEFLTMLYRAKGATPHTPTVACFKDLPLTAWFAAVVCDAAGQTFVAGYADPSDPERAGKTFKPEQAVNRVEALKMMFTVLGLKQQTSVAGTTKALSYIDVASSAWYMQYLSAAFTLNILPVPAQSPTLFGPDKPLSRAEAAAFMYNAIFPTPLSLDGQSVSSSAMQQSSATTSAARSQSSNKSLATQEVGTITAVDFPFNDDGMFTKKLTRSYRFTLKERTTATFMTSLVAIGTQDDISCRLYKLDGDSFSLEYYIGNQQIDTCTVTATLAAGSYQFDIQPRIAGANFSLTTKKVKGDGNDGFVEAKSLVINIPVSTLIDTNDLGDFYAFKLKEQTNMMIELTNAESVKCVIYPMQDVDIYGFAEPDCNKQYDFPAGTYYVGVMQRDGRSAKQSYSIRYKK